MLHRLTYTVNGVCLAARCGGLFNQRGGKPAAVSVLSFGNGKTFSAAENVNAAAVGRVFVKTVTVRKSELRFGGRNLAKFFRYLV